jgi:2-oxoglutarate ferredoxin oxidoreductase subunit alpha
MLHDVREAVAGRAPVRFHGRMGGAMPLPEDIVKELKQLARVPNGVKVEGNHNGHLIR